METSEEQTRDKNVTFNYMGVDVTVPANIADDWEFIEKAAEISNGNSVLVVSFVKDFVGESYEPLKEAIRAEHGHVSMKAMAGVIQAALESAKEDDSAVKNS